MLQAVYAPRGSCQQQAGLLRQLLVALADPLGPAANCSVAVRCAALRHMEAAVDGYLQECAGERSCMGRRLRREAVQQWCMHRCCAGVCPGQCQLEGCN